MDAFRADYEAMQRSMIYGDAPAFDELLRRLKFFNGQVRLMGTGLSLEAVIEKFMEVHLPLMATDRDRRIYKESLTMETSEGTTVSFQLEFHHLSDGWIFEQLNW